MNFYKQNQSWLVGLGVLVTLLWTAQFAADGFNAHSEIQLVQHKKIELAHTIQFEWSESSRASRLESDTDPTALAAAYAASGAGGLGLSMGADAPSAPHSLHTSVLPGIRAPPHPIPSA
jgi:hypothetical protein